MDFEELAERVRRADNIYDLAQLKKEVGPSRSQISEYLERKGAIKQLYEDNKHLGDDSNKWPIMARIEFKYLTCEQMKLENQFPDHFEDEHDRRGKADEDGAD